MHSSRPIAEPTAGARRSSSTQLGRWRWSIEAWSDTFATWRHELERKVAAGQADLDSELSRGTRPAPRHARPHRRRRPPSSPEPIAALADPTRRPTNAAPPPSTPSSRRRHRPSRSQRADPARPRPRARRRAHAGPLRRLVRALPALLGRLRRRARAAPALCRARLRRPLPAADPPDRRDQPQGPQRRAHRRPRRSRAARGRSARPTAATPPSTPSSARSTTSTRLVAAAADHDIEIALDFAIQCSADHPWLNEHPEWFHRRPDGTLKYAENPPKSYQDIYNVDFDCADWRALWHALRDVVLFWVDHGVRIFRVDNPHTKPVAFWEWLIDEVRAQRSRRHLPRRGVHPPRR